MNYSDQAYDPFDNLDSCNEDGSLERVLSDRFDGSYYPSVLEWFFSLLIADGVGASKNLVEVGSGTGQPLNLLASKLGPGSLLIGVDKSAELVESATRRFPSLCFQHADGAALPFPDNHFDAAYIATVLVHVPDPIPLLKEMVRVVRPGGLIAVLDQDFETAVLHPGSRKLTRTILNAASDYWNDGWIGRKLPGFFRRLGIGDIKVAAHVRLDQSFDRPFFERIGAWVVERGVPLDRVAEWLDGLEDGERQGEFFFSRNFYAILGRKPCVSE